MFTDKSFTDHEFVFSSTLSPNMYVEHSYCKVINTLSFVMSVSAKFKLVSPLKTLYYSLVGLILEYGFVILDLYTMFNSIMLKQIQHKFLNYVFHILNIVCSSYDYTPIF